MLIALTIFGLLMAAVTRQLMESVTVTLQTSRMLEYSRNGRTLVGRLGSDLRTSQRMVMYSDFTSRSSTISAGNYGDYLVLHHVNSSGTITRTIGYYAVANGSTGTYILYRHDSADGHSTAGNLPATGTQGTHLKIVGTFKVPSGTKLFRNWSNRGISLRGQFGTATGASTSALNYIQCTLTTRS
jgi:hypothetical protein